MIRPTDEQPTKAEEVKGEIVRLYDAHVVSQLFRNGRVSRAELLSGLEDVLNGVNLPDGATVQYGSGLDRPIDYTKMYEDVQTTGNFASRSVVKKVKGALGQQGINTYTDIKNYFEGLSWDPSYSGIRIPKIFMDDFTSAVLLYSHLDSLGIEVFEGGYAKWELLDDILDSDIERLDPSVRIRKCLMKGGIGTIGELVAKTPNDLLAIKNFGEVSIGQVKEKLAYIGLRLSRKEADNLFP